MTGKFSEIPQVKPTFSFSFLQLGMIVSTRIRAVSADSHAKEVTFPSIIWMKHNGQAQPWLGGVQAPRPAGQASAAPTGSAALDNLSNAYHLLSVYIFFSSTVETEVIVYLFHFEK